MIHVDVAASLHVPAINSMSTVNIFHFELIFPLLQVVVACPACGRKIKMRSGLLGKVAWTLVRILVYFKRNFVKMLNSMVDNR